jgi:microsomal epoxide hydrolase
MQAFVTSMFHTCPARAYVDRLTLSCLRLPEADAEALRHYPVPRSYWKEAILSTDVPVLYAVRPRLAPQARNLVLDRPNTSIAVFPEAGHALFVDDAPRFDGLMQQFLDNNVHL